MKNLKKIAALVIVLAMALSSVSFAAFTDVKDDASYSEAVTVMSALGLLKGYEDGTFAPDKTITRAEFAAVVVRMLGMEVAASGAATATNFVDVPATHWAAGYVKIASQKEIINGYGDGNFGPDDEVTYEQAIKMLVCALGYAPMFADVADAYPTAYMAQANTLGMTVGAAGKIGDKATRAIVARLAYNALDDKIMEQISYGSDKEYGFPENYSTPFSKYLKVAKVDATVTPVGFSAEDATKVNLEDIVIADEYRDVEIDDGIFDAVEGLVIPKGYAVTAYIDYNDEDMVVVAVVPKAGKNKVLELTATQMEGAAFDYANNKLTYYKTSALESSRTEEVKLDDEDFTVYENQTIAAVDEDDYDDIAADYTEGNIPSIKLINNDSDTAYDVLVYTVLESDIVEEIYDSSESLTTVNNGYTYDFDKENEDQIYTLKDVNGKELSFADIKVGDVINVMISEDNNGKKLYEFIISSDKVEGTVTEAVENDYDEVVKVWIGDKEYKLGEGVSINAGDKGIFYVDMMGVILDKELDVSSRTFGILYSISEVEDGADTEIKATIYTKDGNFETFTFAKNVEFVVGSVNNTFASSTFSVDDKVLKSGSTTLIDVEDEAKVIMYSANSSGAINSIVDSAKIKDVTDDDYEFFALDEDVEFRGKDDTLNKKAVTDATVIITSKNADTLVNVNAKDNYAISSKAIFADEETYDIAYIVDSNDEIVYAIVFNAIAKVEPTSPVMVVSAKPSKGETEDGDAYYIIKGYVNGELKSFNVDADTNVEYAVNGEVENYSSGLIDKGALVQYNEGDIASAVRVIATAAQVKDAADGKELTFGVDEDDDEIGFLFAGNVKRYNNGNIYFADDAETLVDFKAGTATVKVTLSGSNIGNVFANYSIGNAETERNAGEGNNDDVVIVYNFDGENMVCVVIDVENDNKK